MRVEINFTEPGKQNQKIIILLNSCTEGMCIIALLFLS